MREHGAFTVSVYVVFTNPEMIRRICKQQDLTFRTIGYCIEALVVNKLAATSSYVMVPPTMKSWRVHQLFSVRRTST